MSRIPRSNPVLAYTEAAPPRNVDVAAIRVAVLPGYGQSTFASMIGVSCRTLEGWESGRRKPNGAARAPLMVIQHNPEAYREAAQAAIATSTAR
jgi:putative transcriptional regulator